MIAISYVCIITQIDLKIRASMRDKAPLKTLAWLLAYSTYDYTMIQSYHKTYHRLLVVTAAPQKSTLA